MSTSPFFSSQAVSNFFEMFERNNPYVGAKEESRNEVQIFTITQSHPTFPHQRIVGRQETRGLAFVAFCIQLFPELLTPAARDRRARGTSFARGKPGQAKDRPSALCRGR